jgi:hypothetical protein
LHQSQENEARWGVIDIYFKWADKLIKNIRIPIPPNKQKAVIINRGNFTNRKKLNPRPTSQENSPLFRSYAAGCI